MSILGRMIYLFELFFFRAFGNSGKSESAQKVSIVDRLKVENWTQKVLEKVYLSNWLLASDEITNLTVFDETLCCQRMGFRDNTNVFING